MIWVEWVYIWGLLTEMVVQCICQMLQVLTAMGRFGGFCPGAYRMSATAPVAPLHSPLLCHRLDLSMTLAPLVISKTGCRPPASSGFVAAATEQECFALMRAIGVSSEQSF